MPSLKDLHCCIELSGTDTKLQEFGTTYSDGCVETFVAVPSGPQPFAIRLSSSDFIAPGLAIYVFIDGVYQCNRNRQNLKLRKPPDRRALVDFRVRQKEEKQKDGSMIARDWKFEKLNLEMANGSTGKCSPNVIENIGCIEVLVLRCAGARNAKSASKTSHNTKARNMKVDGTGGEPDHPLGLDGPWDNFGGPQFDDRDIPMGRRPIAGQGSPVQPTATYRGPPPPLPPQSHLKDTLHRMGGTRHATRSGRQATPASSTHWRSGPATNDRHPPLTFQYGSGPIPHRKRARSAAVPAPSATGGNAQALDPDMLNQLLSKVEVQRQGGSLLGQSVVPTYASHDLPGVWPSSPFGTATQPAHFVASAATPAAYNSVVSGAPGTLWGAHTVPGRADTHAAWGLPATSVAPTAVSNGNTWGYSLGDEESSDSDGSWGAKQETHSRRHKSTRPRGRSESRSPWGAAPSRSKSSDFQNARSRWDRSKSRHSTRSRPRESVWESGTNKGGWTYVETQSDTDSSWSSKNTVRPSSSISRAVPRAAAPPGSVVSYGTHSQKTSTWEAIPTAMNIAPPPGFDREGAPGPFMDQVAFFPESKPQAHEEVGWGETVPKSRRATSARVHQDTWGTSGDENEPPRTAKTIVTVNDESSEPEAYFRGANMKENGTSKSLVKIAGAWVDHQDTKNDGANKHDKTNFDTDWGKLEKDLTATANGWPTNNNENAQTTKNTGWTTSPPKLEPRKSRLSHYRKHKKHRSPSAPAADVAISKPHWQFPPPPPSKGQDSLPSAYGATHQPEPLHTIPKSAAEEKRIEHQVRAGKGTRYEHYVGRPEYIDALEKPFAVFRFKYRSRSTLQDLLHMPIPERPVVPMDTAAAIVSYGLGKPEITKRELEKLPQEKLVEGMLKLQMKLAEKTKGDDKTEGVGRKRTEDWVEKHSRDGEKRRSGRSGRKDRGEWGEQTGGWEGDTGNGGRDE